MRIFVDHLAAGALAIGGDEHHYLGRVRRARPGDAIELYDGAGRRASGVIEKITETETLVRAGVPELIVEPPPRIRALVPVIKGDRMDSCLEKLVEVGVDEIVVWPAARAVVKLAGERRDARLTHYKAIAVAAARQSGRAVVPAVSFGDDLAAMLPSLPAGDHVVLDPACDRMLVETAAEDVTVIAGPEGGLAPEELEVLEQHGFVACSLGPRVLRAETAPVIAVALIRYQRTIRM